MKVSAPVHSQKPLDAGLVFSSRVDAWLVLVIGAAIALCFFEAWRLQSTLAALVGGFTALLVLGLTVPCRYTLTEDHLLIRCGMFRRRVPYSDIQRIEPSRSMLSAPALSLKRVKISGVGRFHLVSPNDRELFIEVLSARVFGRS